MQWKDTVDEQTLHDAEMTAASMGYKLGRRTQQRFTLDEFDQLRTSNHRGARGYDDERDIASVEYSIQSVVSPIVMVRRADGEYVVLDGAHRIAAAYKTGSDISAVVFNEAIVGGRPDNVIDPPPRARIGRGGVVFIALMLAIVLIIIFLYWGITALIKLKSPRSIYQP